MRRWNKNGVAETKCWTICYHLTEWKACDLVLIEKHDLDMLTGPSDSMSIGWNMQMVSMFVYFAVSIF